MIAEGRATEHDDFIFVRWLTNAEAAAGTGQDICINRYADDRSKEEAVYGGPPLTRGIRGEREIERECLAEPEPKLNPALKLAPLKINEMTLKAANL